MEIRFALCSRCDEFEDLLEWAKGRQADEPAEPRWALLIGRLETDRDEHMELQED